MECSSPGNGGWQAPAHHLPKGYQSFGRGQPEPHGLPPPEPLVWLRPGDGQEPTNPPLARPPDPPTHNNQPITPLGDRQG